MDKKKSVCGARALLPHPKEAPHLCLPHGPAVPVAVIVVIVDILIESGVDPVCNDQQR
jgi:hypothetical protein